MDGKIYLDLFNRKGITEPIIDIACNILRERNYNTIKVIFLKYKIIDYYKSNKKLPRFSITGKYSSDFEITDNVELYIKGLIDESSLETFIGEEVMLKEDF